MLATNTSSIPVTSLAERGGTPENVVGMHFFNPPPLMRLLEVIARRPDRRARAVELAARSARRWASDVIVAADGPGFLVNRCGRPFYSEALRLLQERVATHEQIDRICRIGGGFRMGPFELMDLVGIDVGFEVAKSFNELSFGEPRWKPNPIQARMVAAGRLGRKTGRGYYEYAGTARTAPTTRRRSEPRRRRGTLAARRRGPPAEGSRARPAGGLRAPRGRPAGAHRRRSVSRRPIAARRRAGGGPVRPQPRRPRGPGACGFHLLPPLAELVELTRLPASQDSPPRRRRSASGGSAS